MSNQSNEQRQQSSLLDAIFIAPAKEIRTDRFSASSTDAVAPCCPDCHAPCHC